MASKEFFTLVAIFVGIVGAIYIAKFLMFIVAPIVGVVLLLIFVAVILSISQK